MPTHYLWSGQTACHDAAGRVVACEGTGQDAETRPGAPWPQPRFTMRGELVRDHLTGLDWSRRTNPAGFPLSWQEALDYAAGLAAEGHAGRADWRLPNRRELRSLISYDHRDPALPPGHPFVEVFPGWYWTSTTAAINPAFAWYVHTEGGRMFYGAKSQYFLVWPVRGRGFGLLAATGQTACHDPSGAPTACAGSGQDGELRVGAPWPSPRFELLGDDAVRDHLTGLAWSRSADLGPGPVTWEAALAAALAVDGLAGLHGWRLPAVNELESLVDASRYTPALPPGHPFRDLGDAYWSSTSSGYEPDWAMALYLNKGAVGVGQKKDPHYLAWAVRS